MPSDGQADVEGEQESGVQAPGSQAWHSTPLDKFSLIAEFL